MSTFVPVTTREAVAALGRGVMQEDGPDARFASLYTMTVRHVDGGPIVRVRRREGFHIPVVECCDCESPYLVPALAVLLKILNGNGGDLMMDMDSEDEAYGHAAVHFDVDGFVDFDRIFREATGYDDIEVADGHGDVRVQGDLVTYDLLVNPLGDDVFELGLVVDIVP